MKKKIIIAASIQSAVSTAASLFSRGSVAVLTAGTCEEILQLHRAQKADLIIGDAALPAMGGAALCRTIRKDPGLKDVSIVMACSGGEQAVAECRTAGSNDVLAMPLDPVRLFSTVSAMLVVQNRLAVRIPLRIMIEGRDGKETFVGMSQDLSVSGMLIESARLLQPGDRLHCNFTIGARAVSVDCEVVRMQPKPAGGFQFGVRFVNIDAKTFVILEHIVKSNAPAQGHQHA
jgi:CheY-like chemotaxis protein